MTPGRIAQPADCRKASQDRRGRKALLWGLAAFALFQVAFYPMNELWPQLQDGEYGSKLNGLRAQLAAKPEDQPCVVMIGGSLTSWGFNPSALTTLKPRPGGPAVYNVSINNGRAVVQLLCLRRLLAEGIRPNLVLMDTYPWCFYQGYNGFDGEQYFSLPRVQRQDLSALRRYRPDANRLCRDWRLLCCTPWYSYRRNLQRYYLPDWTTPAERQLMWWNVMDGNGWEYIPWHVAGMRQTPRSVITHSIQYYLDGMNGSPIDDDTFPRVYREMAEACRRDGVPIVLVRMPETALLRRGFSPEVARKIESIYADLTRDAGVRVVDARAWMPNDDLFIDGFHLNAEGSTLFTRRLEREVIAPCVCRPSPGLASSR